MLEDIIKLRHLRWFFMVQRAPRKLKRESKNRILQYKDKYKGKRCFIIGNGPSLSSADLDLIKNEVSFASNRIYKIFDQTEWRPTFYCCQDDTVMREMGDEVVSAIDCAEFSFFRMASYKLTQKFYNGRNNIGYIPLISQVNERNRIKFTNRADRYLYDGSTVTYYAMELAAYMGFSEIYLLGVDCAFPFVRDLDGNVEVDMSKTMHFYEVKEENSNLVTIEQNIAPLFNQRKAYQSCENYSRTSGKFRVYNSTRGGELEIFERIELEKVVRT